MGAGGVFNCSPCCVQRLSNKDVNTLKRTLVRTKQLDRDPLFEVVSVRLQTDSSGSLMV
ncbi:hypothetical protein CRENBAI_010342 [Crenichthys baileyi]|uniref:Uncharacterized protein n=1 Tax=Crenichthys baileyi TaxID=28760 RepID=A0AAV9RMG5_9TELE